jgi:hypothetical protein
MAAESFCDGNFVTRAVKNDVRADGVPKRGVLVEMTHAAQIALALFADIAGEDQIASEIDACVFESRRNCEQTDDTSSVVTGARRFQSSPLKLWRDARLGREDGVNVRREKDAGFRRLRSFSDRDGVADGVEVDLIEVEIAKSLAEPFSAPLLAKRGRRDSHEIRLPAQNLLFLKVQPLEGPMHAPVRRKLGDAGEGRCWDCGCHDPSA